MPGSRRMPRYQTVFKLLRSLERVAAYAQGKGYGSASIARENEMIHRALSRRPALAVDIGANVGDFTAELRRRNPELEIHAFEPSGVNLEKLKVRFSHDPRVIVCSKAVSNSTGGATLYSNASGSGLSSLTRRRLDHLDIAFDVMEKVTTVRFEDYWEEKLGKRCIDIVKMDIEGHELEALQGFGDAMRSVRVLQFEFGGCNVDTRTFFRDFWYFFADKGFTLFRITPFGLASIDRYKEADEYFSTTNYIAVNSSPP
jgi:FkbM family methyltransferase